ncbi:MAG TPA: sulfotransferase, partial [Planctomycetes bacterium]|nr:sulfotransferase [Planctomycetota bacterium]
EFLPAMARAFPTMRFVLIVRDLRAIVASQNSQSVVGVGKRPLLFYARHWRKSVAYTRLFERHDPRMRGRVHVVRYEDLVTEPERVLRGVCSFLEAPFDEQMLEPGRYRALDERGTWTPNSAFEERGAALFQDSIDRWRGVLRGDEVRAIEALAGPELVEMGYTLTAPPIDPLECLELDCEPRVEELAPWIRPFPCSAYLDDPELARVEYGWEARRRAMIEGAGVLLPGEEELVLDRRVLEDLRTAWTPLAGAA